MPATPPAADDLAHRVDAFEEALAADPSADLADHLPPPAHPDHRPVLAELVRVDMERAWARRQPRRLADYRQRFPAALADPHTAAAVAFEEYRQRRLAGEPVTADEYAVRYRLDTSDWPDIPPGSAVVPHPPPARPVAPWPIDADTGPRTEPVRKIKSAAPPADDPPTAAVAVKPQATGVMFPAVGGEFLGFKLDEELGRGAFGRVYLARQADLSERPVVLKVATNMAVESRHLAQLQHTHIVPVYSFHAAGPLQAACMPYFGRTTLLHVLRAFRDRETMPATGRDLKSTLRTAGGSVSAHRLTGSAVVETPAPRVVPSAPTDPGPPDGWAALEHLGYTDAVLHVTRQLAVGLAHAHARGILHRDLKPANVLLTDDGRPMLLDFNIAEDTKARAAGPANIGGTLPYMAPEQMAAYRAGGGPLDARADVYAVGVMLFQLLAGRHPFPDRDGPPPAVIDQMLADRRGPLPTLRAADRRIPWAVQAIVHACLAFDPADRYPSAADLRDDLARQLSHRPLRFAPDRVPHERLGKWAKRHPRLTSTAAVAGTAAAVLAAVGVGLLAHRERVRGLEARDTFAAHTAAFRDAQAFLDDRNAVAARPADGLDKLRAVLDRYGVPDADPDADWQQRPDVRYLSPEAADRLREDVGEAFYLMAKVGHLRATAGDRDRLADADRWNRLAELYADDRIPRAVREQRADLAAVRGDAAAEAAARAELRDHPPASPRDRYLIGYWLAQQGKHAAALPHLRAATQHDPEHFSSWYVRGTAHAALVQHEMAAMCFGSCTALRREFAPAWLNRGLAYAHLRFHDQACDDFERALALRPGWAEAHLLRAASREALGDPAGAEADLTAAVESADAPPRALFLRATFRDRTGNPTGAADDRAEAMKQTPADELSWVARGECRMGDDPKGALDDADEALKRNPLSVYALQLKAHLLAERLDRPADAVAVLDLAVKYYPDYVPARAGRGVLHARRGDRTAAVRDAQDALLRDTKAPNLYQVGCIYALTGAANPDDRTEARRLLRSALRTGFGLDIVDTDPDLDPLRDDPEFRRLVAEAKQFFAQRR